MSFRATATSQPGITGLRNEADIVAQFRARHLELVRLAVLLLGDAAAAEDVVQDVFARVWEGRDRLAAAGFTAAYFYRAVVNGCRSVHRRRRPPSLSGAAVEAALLAVPEVSAEEAAPRAIPLSVAAAPDDRTFYALYANWGRVPGDFWVYRFRLTPSGTATRPAAVSGGLITGQDDIGNVGGFVVSPDGARLALAVASVHDGSSQSTVAGEILVIDLRTGDHLTWQGGMERPGQAFGIQNLSWTGNGKALAYRGQWCPVRDLSYGFEGGFDCSTLGQGPQPVRAEGVDVVREISVTPGGGTLDSGLVLRAPAKVSEPEPVVIDPSGEDLITLVNSSAPSVLNLVKVSIATGRVTSVLGSVPRGVARYRADGLAVDPTGRYALIWMNGNVTRSLGPLHGWVHGGAYHRLPPALSPYGGAFQMTW